MEVEFWGVRGSVPVADEAMLGHGGNTSCLSVCLSDGSRLVLDAGTGVRGLGVALSGVHEPIHLLLSHLHLDHIMGLMFFGPLFDPASHVTVWGPPSTTTALRDRLGRYLSAPLSPIEIRELPADVAFNPCPPERWTIGPATIEAGLVLHRGPTLGYRITDGDSVLCYLSDHEPALGQDLERDDAEWISGFGLARGASLLVHDGQYTDREYGGTRGWGHSRVDDALAFGRRAEVGRLALFHHDPAHDDDALEAIGAEAREQWAARGGDARAVTMAREGETIVI
jgi:phosphoribosyl 1,2-cyclic phosphodiesterase